MKIETTTANTRSDRIYICNEKFETVTIVEEIASDSRLSAYPLGISLEIGPTYNNIPPPRIVAVTDVADMPMWVTLAWRNYLHSAPLGVHEPL
jgi:hypothetical protein